jgi:6-phosphofructokinase 1
MGILVGGGPAPGINSAIGAAVIEAVNSGLPVVGILDGYKHLAEGRTDIVRPLDISDVSRIHYQGGSILRTSRTNPARDSEVLARTVDSIKSLGIEYLVTIGGDDTAFGASEIAKAAGAAGNRLKVAHVPKTIDNDLPLPGGQPTFGFETVRQVGTEAVLNLMEEARTTNRWYFVVVMGREAGHLALGIAKAAGATLALIPEEFPEGGPTLDQVSKILEGAILKRRVMGHEHGVAVIGEGIAEKLSVDELKNLPGVTVEYDSYGHIALNDIPLAIIMRRQVQQAFSQRGEDIAIVDVTLGYQLRGAPPIPFDIDYTRTLGYGAVRFLLEDTEDERLRYGGLICQLDGHRQVLAFDDLRDPETGRIRVRRVDIESEYYAVAREYMIRIDAEDWADRQFISQMAQAANMSLDDFEGAFGGAGWK